MRGVSGLGGSKSAQRAGAGNGKRGLSRVVVLGGTNRKASRIRELTPAAIEWRFVDGLKRISSKEAASDLDWGDVVVIWATTPLLHRVSNLFAKGPRTITAPTTGIAALAREVAKFAVRQQRQP